MFFCVYYTPKKRCFHSYLFFITSRLYDTSPVRFLRPLSSLSITRTRTFPPPPLPPAQTPSPPRQRTRPPISSKISIYFFDSAADHPSSTPRHKSLSAVCDSARRSLRPRKPPLHLPGGSCGAGVAGWRNIFRKIALLIVLGTIPRTIIFLVDVTVRVCAVVSRRRRYCVQLSGAVTPASRRLRWSTRSSLPSTSSQSTARRLSSPPAHEDEGLIADPRPPTPRTSHQSVRTLPAATVGWHKYPRRPAWATCVRQNLHSQKYECH